MVITKKMVKWILLVAVFVIIDANGKVTDKILRPSSKLSSIVRDVTLSPKDSSKENVYTIENNDTSSGLEIGKEKSQEELSDLHNSKGNMTAENETVIISNDIGTIVKNNSNEDYPLHRGDLDVFDEYELFNNESQYLGQSSKQVTINESEKSQNSIMSRSTISWLESFMFLYRNWQWILFNTLFMVTWIFFAIFALYRLIGLYWCCLLFSRSLYLVLHLLVFTAATFSVVELLHLSYGNHQGLPLFLTLLLTHTPSPCLAVSCYIVTRSIFAAANVSMYGTYIASLVHVGIYSTIVLFLSFIGDVIVGISHSSIILVLFRVLVNVLCILPLILFVYKYVQIRRIHKSLQREFVRELKSLVPHQRSGSREDVDMRSTLRSILNPWAQMTVFSASCGIVMLFCNFSLSLFFTISNVSLSLFWVLHSTLFISQIALVVSITAGATLTLTNVTRRNICRRYFFIPLPRHDVNGGPFVQHGNFIYQRVSVSNVANGNIQHPNYFNNEPSESTQNNTTVSSFVSRPKANVRRSATFNCPPRSVYTHTTRPYNFPVHPVLSDHLLCTYPINETEVIDNNMCALQCRNNNYGRNDNVKPYSKPISDTDEYQHSPGKFPIMGCNGRSRYGSLHSLPNISPRIRTQPMQLQHYIVNEGETYIKSAEHSNASNNLIIDNNVHESSTDANQTGNCVKDIIMENQNLFRSYSLRQNSLRRKIRNRERIAIRTIPSQNNSRNLPSFPPLNGNKENGIETTIKHHGKYPHEYDYNIVGPSNHENVHEYQYYTGLENGKIYDQDISSESNSVHKIDIHNYEPHDVYKGLEISVGGLKFGYDNNADREKAITTEVNTFQAEILPIAEVNVTKDSPTRDLEDRENYHTDQISITPTSVHTDETMGVNSENIISEDFSAFTLPSQKRATIKRNSSFETKNLQNGLVPPVPIADKSPIYGNNWYGTWAGRKSKRRFASNNDASAVNLRKLSASKTSLSNLYEKLKPRKHKSSMTSIITMDVEEAFDKLDTIENELVIVENNDDSEEETLPKISEDIDLASEILKSSSMLADFLVSKECDDVNESNFNTLNEVSLETPVLKIIT